jgi:integrase
MRIGELLGLEWGDIDFNSLFIKVQRAQVRGVIGPPKNGRSRRVDMSLQLADVLAALRTERRKEALRQGQPEIGERVFLTERDARIDLDHFRRRVFHLCLEKAGLRHLRIHDLRHTYASLLIAQKESLAYIRDQLGHGSIKITVDTYGHLVPGSNRAAVDQLDDAQPIRNPGATSGAILGSERWV